MDEASALIVHLMPSPVSAKRFVEPLVGALNANGLRAELWVDPSFGHRDFVSTIGNMRAHVRFNLEPSPFRSAANLLQLLTSLSKARPLVVHAHQTRGAVLPLIAAALLRIKVRIYHNHGSAFRGSKGVDKVVFWCLEKLICFIATNVVFVTEDLQRDFIDAKLVAPAKAVVIGPGSACGIDLSEYDLSQFSAEEKVRQRRNLGVEDGRFVVLYIGRPYKRKGFHFLLNYWARRGRNLCDGQLFLAGCSAEDVHSVLGFPLRPEITPVGYVTDLRPYLSAADVVVLPSEHEGFSYSVLEAFAAGRCVIASDVPGLRTQVMHEQTGLLFPYGNEEEFHAKLAAIRQSDILRTSLETAARRFAERYSRPSYLRHFLVTMSALIRGAADAGPASNT